MSEKSEKVFRVEAAGGAGIAQALVPEAVVGGSLVRVAEDAVSFRRFLELLFCGLVAGIAVGWYWSAILR